VIGGFGNKGIEEAKDVLKELLASRMWIS